MKILCAPDKFKESLTAIEAAHAMRQGILRACPTAVIDLCPIADGGEGFLDTLHAAQGGTYHTARVTGPRLAPVEARWLSLPTRENEPPTAAIEMAQASGLQLLALSQRDPTQTTTHGTGQLIAAAIHAGHRRILIGIGGSATTDGGLGMAAALGARCFNEHDHEITTIPVGNTLSRIHRIDLVATRELLRDTEIIAACDVNNPLTGPQGAAHIYGPQKGATPAQVLELDAGLRHLARLIHIPSERDLASIPGAGAAGGLGFGLMAFANATLKPGIELVLEAVRFRERLMNCDLCLTGEGKLDEQSLAGKACIGIARLANTEQVPTIALVGASDVTLAAAQHAGLTSYHVIGAGLSRADSMRRAAQLLEQAAERVTHDRLKEMNASR